MFLISEQIKRETQQIIKFTWKSTKHIEDCGKITSSPIIQKESLNIIPMLTTTQ